MIHSMKEQKCYLRPTYECILPMSCIFYVSHKLTVTANKKVSDKTTKEKMYIIKFHLTHTKI